MAKTVEFMTLLAKLEVTQNLDPVPTGGANGLLAFNVKVTPMPGQDAERKRSLPYFSAPQKFPSGMYREITFETEMVGHAVAGTQPAWSAIAKAAGLAETLNAGVSVVYNPIAQGAQTATLYFYRDGTLFKLRGARGDATIKLSAHALPMIAWKFIGLYDEPTDVANATPTLTGFQQPMVANKVKTPTFTINGFAAVMRNFELALNSKLIYRELVNSQAVHITGRDPMISTQIEAESMATLNPFNLAENQTAFAISLIHGVGAGKIISLSAPSCRMMRPDAETAQDGIAEWPLKITPLPVAGNDDFTLTLT